MLISMMKLLDTRLCLYFNGARKKSVCVHQCQFRCNFTKFSFVTQWLRIDGMKKNNNNNIFGEKNEEKRKQYQNKTKNCVRKLIRDRNKWCKWVMLKLPAQCRLINNQMKSFEPPKSMAKCLEIFFMHVMLSMLSLLT